MPTYVDIHILQTLPPSNINRDDAGSPKQAMYGGARRARVSSQAWKRATRTAFVELLDISKEDLATRTKRLSALLAQRLTKCTTLNIEDATRLTTALITALGITADKKKPDETSYLLFLGRSQLDALVELIAPRAEELLTLEKKAFEDAAKQLAIKEVLSTGHPIDVALFGRMVADIPALNVDAATQVAHALSTHAAELEFDYFTAVDDENTNEQTGAGMIGIVEFNSSTLYRYATVGLDQLMENLGDDKDAAIQALEHFINAYARSMPSGHKNSFGNGTLPSVVSVVIRKDQPVNLVSAFEKPITSREGLLGKSAERLAKEMAFARETWGMEPISTTSMYRKDDSALVAEFGEPVSFQELVSTISAQARQCLESGTNNGE